VPGQDFTCNAGKSDKARYGSLWLQVNSVAFQPPSNEYERVTSTTPAPDFPTLTTNRLMLREITHDDTDAVLGIHGDPELMEWFGEPLADRDGATKLINILATWRLLPDPGVRWGIERHDAHGLIGSCGLFLWRRTERSCTLGYELAGAAQGRGYMTEALQAAIAWGFEHMHLHRIEARIHPENTPSLNLAKRLGFSVEGLLREAAFWSGQHHDLQVLSLLETDR